MGERRVDLGDPDRGDVTARSTPENRQQPGSLSFRAGRLHPSRVQSWRRSIRFATRRKLTYFWGWLQTAELIWDPNDHDAALSVPIA